LDGVGESLYSTGGVYPRREVEVVVDRERCTGCGMCATLAPTVMRMADGKAQAHEGALEWSRADGAFVTECPVQAISVMAVDADGQRHRTMEFRVESDG
jgi:NTE family protein